MVSLDFSRDPLTGVPNLIGFLEAWESLRAGRWAITAYDLVGFAGLRARRGSPAADQVVQAMVASLDRAGRELAGEGAFHVYRTGTDEFLLLLPGTVPVPGDVLGARIVRSFWSRAHATGAPLVGVRWATTCVPDVATTAEGVLIDIHFKLRQPGLHRVSIPPAADQPTADPPDPGPVDEGLPPGLQVQPAGAEPLASSELWLAPSSGPAGAALAAGDVMAAGTLAAGAAGGAGGGPPPWVERLLSRVVRRFTETIALLRETQALALTDAVSGLPNHRAAEAKVEQLVAHYHREGIGFAVLFVDGDNLRAYNEIDYEAGNRMIADLGHTLQQSLRAEDYVARWLSGDEFLVLLPGVTRQGAMAVARRLLDAVSQASRSWLLPVTVSIGIAVCPDDGTDGRTLIRRAAAANSQAKQAGKNRVC